MTTPRWIPELEAEALPLQRIFLAEKWIVARLHYGHVDPREAGVGNIVNCGAAMYMAPVGLVNAAHPRGRVRRGAGRRGRPPVLVRPGGGRRLRGGGRRGLRPGRDARTPSSTTCLALAKDGTRAAIEAVCEVAARHTDFESALARCARRWPRSTRSAPTTATPPSAPAAPPGCTPSRNSPSPSGMLLVGGGDYRHAVLGAVNYGRDCDSIATMAGALAGALGARAIPDDWAKTVAEASRLDLHAPATALTEVDPRDLRPGHRRRRAHEAAFAALAGRR